jgi:alpha-mannosidase
VESAFDVVEREIDHGPESPWFGGVNATFPMHRFVDISDDEAGFAILNDGLREYQVSEDTCRTIALTLMRAYEVSLTTVSKRWDAHPEMTLSQCPGEHEFRYWIYPHKGRWDKGEVMREAEVTSVPLEIVQAGAHGGDLPKQKGFLCIEPSNLVLTALKHSESGDRLVMRFFNPTTKVLSGKIKTNLKVKSAYRLTLEEKEEAKLEVKRDSVSLKVEPKKIVTLGLDLDR